MAGEAHPDHRTAKAGAKVAPEFTFQERWFCPNTSHSGILAPTGLITC